MSEPPEDKAPPSVDADIIVRAIQRADTVYARAGQGLETTDRGVATPGDVMNGIYDALEHPRPPKPTPETLANQLAAPVLLAGKSLYDFVAALLDLIDKHGDATRTWVLFFLSLGFMGVSGWITAGAIRAYREELRRSYPAYERALNWVKHQRKEHKLDKYDLPPN